MAFDPDQYLKLKQTSASFDPDAYLSTYGDSDVSQLESGLRGAAQGVSLGFSDEITGALESLLSDKTYEQARNESRDAYHQAQDANPYTYGAGQVGGSLATAFVPGLGTMNLAKAAAMGATQALGDSEASNATDMAKDVALGGAIGGGAYGAINKVVAPAAKYLGSKASEYVPDAMDFATKKIGKGLFGVDEKATANYLQNSKDVNRAYSMGELADSVLNNTDDLSALNEMRRKSSNLSNDAWKTLSETKGIPKQGVLDSISAYIDDPKVGLTIDGVTVGNAQEQAIKRLNQLQKQISSLGGDEISETNLKRIIQNLDDNINWNNPEQGPTNDAIKSLRSYIDQTVKGQNPAYKQAMTQVEDVTKAQQEVKSVFQNRMNPDNYDKFNKQVKNLINKDELSAANRAVDKIQEHTGHDLRKDIVDSWTKAQFEKGDVNGSRKTLLGTVVGGSGGSILAGPVGGAIGGAIGGATGYTADRYAGPIFKKFLDGTINANEFMSNYGSGLGKYAKVLSEASTRGPQALSATHFLLSQRDPEYRQRTKALEGDE